MKKLVVLIIALFAFITLSSAQKNAFSVQSGYSYSTGLIGAEYQYKKFAIGAGIMPFRNDVQEIKPSYSAVVTYYSRYWNQNSWYVSGAFASGRHNGDYPDNPMFIFSVGGKEQIWSGLSIKGGFGYAFTQDDAFPVFELGLHWSFGI
jgi:hypothetical protein